MLKSSKGDIAAAWNSFSFPRAGDREGIGVAMGNNFVTSLIPHDDGAAKHLPGIEMPDVTLAATDGTTVDLRGPGLSVVYAYPRTSPPDGNAIDGWEAIPGVEAAHLNLALFATISVS